mmetsp:Transcript_19798/g.46198  ORF Transcript_19798/g.46198 Transcript_19798/m.46198 type:complete len:650 (-) Transcript_19798:195-2144(-)
MDAQTAKQKILQIQSAHGKSKDHLDKTLASIEESVRYQAQGGKKPWVDDDGHVFWSRQRIQVAKIMFSQSFETIMGLIIVTNLVFIMIEVDQDATCQPDFAGSLYSECPTRSDSVAWLRVVSMMLLVTYSVECLVRFYVERLKFFCNTWNMIDLVTVLLGWTSTLLAGTANFNLLRLSRLVRVIRAARVFISVPELYLLISGLYSSIKAIIFGSLMLGGVILVWAVISVEVIHPVAVNTNTTIFPSDCTRCPDGFKSVMASSLTLFQQIVAGDSWGTISIPVIEAAPFTAPLFFAIMMTVSLGVMNLILAVIVERAAEARSNDQERKLKKMQQDRAKNMFDLAILCASMDADGSGALSLEEMLTGYDDDVGEFRKLMQVMDIQRDDVASIFEVLDTDSSGEVSYLEFCQHLGSFFERDPNVMNALVKYSILELKKVLKSEISEVVRENNMMLWEQKKMLWEQRRLMEALRRENSSRTSQECSGASPDGDASYSPLGSELPPKVPALPPDLTNFQDLQNELRILLAKAEDISMAVLPDAGLVLPKDQEAVKVATEVAGRRSRVTRKSTKSRSFDNGVPGAQNALKPSDDFQECRDFLCDRFEERMREAERLQQQFRQIIGQLISIPADAGDGKANCLSEHDNEYLDERRV